MSEFVGRKILRSMLSAINSPIYKVSNLAQINFKTFGEKYIELTERYPLPPLILAVKSVVASDEAGLSKFASRIPVSIIKRGRQ